MGANNGSINFGNIPVGSGGGVSVTADEGLFLEGTVMKLGAVSPDDTIISSVRRILIDPGASLELQTSPGGLNIGTALMIDATNGIRIESPIGIAAQRQSVNFNYNALEIVNSGGAFGIDFVGNGSTLAGNVSVNAAAISLVSVLTGGSSSLEVSDIAGSINLRIGGLTPFSIQDIGAGAVSINVTSLDPFFGTPILFLDNVGTVGFQWVFDQSLNAFSIQDGSFAEVVNMPNDGTQQLIITSPVLGVGNPVLTVGNVAAGVSALDTANYLPVTIGGVNYRLALAV